MNRALVVGASGLVGKELMRVLDGKGYDTWGTYHGRVDKYTENMLMLDVRHPATVEKIFQITHPDVVFISAYETGVDFCEQHQEASDKTNIDGIGNVVDACMRHDAFPVFFSSSYVFDGKKQGGYVESNLPNPICHYGRQKLETEKMVDNADGLIIRTISVFGKSDLNYVSQVVDNCKKGKKMLCPIDQWVNPISAASLARRSVDLFEGNQNGIFHVAGKDCVTKYEWALTCATQYRLDFNCIVPATTRELRQAAKRPANGCLNSEFFDNENTHSLAQELASLKNYYVAR